MGEKKTTLIALDHIGVDDDIECAIHSDASVLITGADDPTRTSLAYLLHRRGNRGSGPFVIYRDRASDRFGTFQPSKRRRPSRNETDETEACWSSANEGTLFIEEVAHLSGAIQAELTRFLELAIPGTRVITATAHDLVALAASKRFRDDLLYRLNTIHLVIPRRASSSVLCSLVTQLM